MSNSFSKSQEQYWSTEGGDIWLQNLQNFESMIAPIGNHLLETKLTDNPKNIIDIGCGGGATTFAIADSIGASGSVIGVDISQSLIRDCRLRAEHQGIKNIEFICGDAASIDMPKGWADFVISRFGVMFFKDPVIAFSHIAQSLKPSGGLAFSCWAPLPDNPWMSRLLTILGKYTALPKPEPGAPGPFAYSNTDYIRSILASAGYQNIEVEAWSGELLIGLPGMSPENVARFLFSSSSLVRSVKNNITEMETTIFDEFTQELAKFYKNGGVYMPAKSWIISATK
jgi:SAM-dependent methyltransferase